MKTKNLMDIGHLKGYKTKLINIKQFAELNLNFEKASPRHFDLSINYTQRIKQRTVKTKPILRNINLDNYDSLLLLSGGIDSVGGLLRCRSNGVNVLPMWVDFGQKNQISERKIIQKIEKKLGIPILKIRIDLKNYVNKGWVRWKYGIIPCRNFLFVTLAGLFVAINQQKEIKIYLCASRGEINSNHNDESLNFYRTVSKLLSLYHKKIIKVWTPFYGYNKTEIIKYWEKKWYPKYNISVRDATTCFLGNNCGSCSACYYRRISTSVANVKDKGYKNSPFKDKGRIIRDYYIPGFKNWGKIRKIDFLIALAKNRSILPLEAKKFLKKHISWYNKEKGERLNSLEKINIS